MYGVLSFESINFSLEINKFYGLARLKETNSEIGIGILELQLDFPLDIGIGIPELQLDLLE